MTARTSAFAFRGKEQDVRKIAEALNLRTILEGSVRRSYLQAFLGVRSAGEAMPAARAQAQKALDRSPSNARAHGLLCGVAGNYDYNWHEAGEQYRLTMAAEPVQSEVRARCALSHLLPLNRLHEALEQSEKALERDPLNAFVRGAFAMVLATMERHDRALIEAQKAVEVDANFWIPHFAIAFSYAASGKLDHARAPAEKSVQAAPWQAQAVGLLAGILARLGEKQRADDLVAKLGNMAPVGLLFYHSLCSEDDRTVDLFVSMVEERDPHATAWYVLKPLRASPRWPKLVKMMNLPEGA